jgi:hypothetical protein
MPNLSIAWEKSQIPIDTLGKSKDPWVKTLWGKKNPGLKAPWGVQDPSSSILL